jgi:hypothetical protein
MAATHENCKTIRQIVGNGHRTPEGERTAARHPGLTPDASTPSAKALDDRQSPVHVSVTSSPKGGFQHGMSSQFHATSRCMP